MSLAVNNQTIIKNNQKPQMNTTFKANPIVTTNTLERTTATDTLVKPAENKTKKTLLTLSAIILAGVGIFAAVKAGKAHQQKKAIQEIEKKFADLQGDIPKVQKTFKEVFLREDLTEKEAIEMLNRYKEVEKIGITGKKEDYIEALFKETKKNHNLGEGLLMEWCPYSSKTRIADNMSLTDTIIFNSNASIEDLRTAVFHELRHAKQDYIVINYDVEKFFKAWKVKNKEHIIPYLQRKCGITNFNKTNNPRGLDDYIKKCLDGYENYVSPSENAELYYKNFLEVDARKAQTLMLDLFGKITN